MTNLEILIEFLDLEGPEKNMAILSNFENQSSDIFYVGEDCYRVLSWEDLKDIAYDKEELFFEEMLDYLEDSNFFRIARNLHSENYIKSVISSLDENTYDFPGLEYLGGAREGKYIFNATE